MTDIDMMQSFPSLVPGERNLLNQSEFVDISKESGTLLALGKVRFLTRNLKNKGVPVNLDCLRVVKNYF